MTRLFKSWLNMGRGAVRGDRGSGSQSWNSLKRVSKHCKLHRCTRSLLYKVPYKVQTQKTHSAEKINRDTKNFPNTVTKQHKHKRTKKRLLEESLEKATAVQYHHIEHCDQVAALESSLFYCTWKFIFSIALESSDFQRCSVALDSSNIKLPRIEKRWQIILWQRPWCRKLKWKKFQFLLENIKFPFSIS